MFKKKKNIWLLVFSSTVYTVFIIIYSDNNIRYVSIAYNSVIH